jgi:hypothetical protein
VSNVSTKIQPVLIVSGSGVPVISDAGAPSAFDFIQDLAVVPLDGTDAIASVKKALWMSLHLTDPLVAQQTLTIRLDSASGAGFDTVILSEDLPALTEDKFFAFPSDTLLRAGDHIQVELTTSGGETATVNGTLMFGV